MHRHFRGAIGRVAGFALLFVSTTIDASAAAGKGPVRKGGLTLQVQGVARTAAGPLANATVTGFGGVASAPVVTGPGGNFTVTVDFSAPDALAKLSVRGSGAQSHVEFVSVPGTYTTMSAAAVDTTLDSSEDPYVDLDPHTTAVYLAMRAVDPMASAAGWQRARRGFATDDSIQRTFILGALADSLVSMPAGAATTLEAASGLSTAQDVQDRLFGPNGGACLSTPICDLVTYYRSPAALPVRTTPILDEEFRAYFPFRSASSQNLAGLTLSTGGTGGVVTVQQRTPIVWAQIGDYIRVHRGDDAPMQSNTFNSAPVCAGAQVRTVVDILAFRVRQLVAPGGGILLQYSMETRTSYPDTPACTDVNQTPDPNIYLRVVAASQVPIPITDPTGKTLVLPVCETACADPPVISTTNLNRAMEPHRFDPGGVGAQLRLGRTFTWTLTGGRLNLAYSNGHSANITQVSDEKPDIGTAVTRYIDTTGVHLIAAGYIAEKDPAAIFGANVDAAAGVYESRINREFPFAAINSATTFRVPFGFTFFRDGTGTRFDGPNPHVWFLDAPDRIRHDRFAAVGSTMVIQRRFWEVIRANGDELLVLESFMAAPPFFATEQPTGRLFPYIRGRIAEPGSAPEAVVPLATPGDGGDAAGTAVASGGDFVVVGAPSASSGGADGGAVYVYAKPTAAMLRDAKGVISTKGLTLLATITAPGAITGDKFGASVTISPDGSSIAIGAPGAATTGQVTVFDKPPGGWANGLTPVQTFTPPAIPGAVVRDFGASIAMTPGGTIAVGAPGTEVGATQGAGMASVYTPNGTGFNAPQQIMPGAAQAGAGFGTSLAASNEMLAIGAPNEDAQGVRDSGAVHAYSASGASFNFAATLSQAGADSIGNKFGTGVSVRGSTILVGAPFADGERGTDTGAGYLYDGTADVLANNPSATLRPQAFEGDGGGASVALIDGAAVLGAPNALRDGALASGAAFVFRRPGTAWTGTGELGSEREIGPAAAQRNQRFGASLAFEQDFLVAGSPNRDRGNNTDQGEADTFAFDRIFGSTFE